MDKFVILKPKQLDTISDVEQERNIPAISDAEQERNIPECNPLHNNELPEKSHSENINTSQEQHQNTADLDVSVSGVKAKKVVRKFKGSWKGSFDWIEAKIGPEDYLRPFCKHCQVFLPNLKPHLVRHENTYQHKSRIKLLKKQPLIDHDIKTQEFEKKVNKIKISELRIIMFLIQHNLPFCLITPIIALVKSICDDSEVAKGLKCGKTKATHTVNTLFLEEGLEVLATHLKNHTFSLIVDETADIGTNKCLVLVVRYFDYLKGKVRDRFLGLMQLKSSDSLQIYLAIAEMLKNMNIPFQNLIGFASDNASVMTGRKSGVKTLLQREQSHLYVMGCICHSLHLCASAASKKLPPHLEILARNIYSFFAHSPKRQAEFKQFQEFFSVKIHKILKVASTRWLSLQNVVERILEQWIPLQHFFISYELDTNADLAHAICSEMTKVNETYFYFLAYILNLTNKINVEFQAEAPRIHILLPTIKNYFKTILQNFVKPEYVDAVLEEEIDIEAERIYLPINDIYIGGKAAIIISKNLISHSDIKDIKIACRGYYIEIGKQILLRIKFKDEVLSALQGIDPKNLTPTLAPLIALFPHLVCDSDVESLDEEWRLFINQTLISKDLPFQEFYQSVFQLKNALSEPMFPKIRKFIGSVMALPQCKC